MRGFWLKTLAFVVAPLLFGGMTYLAALLLMLLLTDALGLWLALIPGLLDAISFAGLVHHYFIPDDFAEARWFLLAMVKLWLVSILAFLLVFFLVHGPLWGGLQSGIQFAVDGFKSALTTSGTSAASSFVIAKIIGFLLALLAGYAARSIARSTILVGDAADFHPLEHVRKRFIRGRRRAEF